jgi:26S proteasome regulatory subunit N2
MPKFSFKSNARPSLFAYPPEVKPPVAAAPTKAPAAVLSTALKIKQRKKEGGPTPMEIEEKEKKEKEEKEKKEKEEAEKKEEEKPEPAFEILSNPSRVTLAQQRVPVLSSRVVVVNAIASP